MNGVDRSGFALQFGIQRMNGIEFVDFRPFQFADKQHIRDNANNGDNDLLRILKVLEKERLVTQGGR